MPLASQGHNACLHCWSMGRGSATEVGGKGHGGRLRHNWQDRLHIEHTYFELVMNSEKPRHAQSCHIGNRLDRPWSRSFQLVRAGASSKATKEIWNTGQETAQCSQNTHPASLSAPLSDARCLQQASPDNGSCGYSGFSVLCRPGVSGKQPRRGCAHEAVEQTC